MTAGKVRRFYLHQFRRRYVEQQVAKRQGDCGRCAACCKLLFRCPFLDDSGPLPTCSIHDRRPDNCRFFPIDPRDLADRDLVDPANPCGFSFPDSALPNGAPARTAVGAGTNGHSVTGPSVTGHTGHSAMSDDSPLARR